MLPLSVPVQSRTSRRAVRVIGVTPPGVSTNKILESIAADLSKMCTKGMQRNRWKWRTNTVVCRPCRFHWRLSGGHTMLGRTRSKCRLPVPSVLFSKMRWRLFYREQIRIHYCSQ